MWSFILRAKFEGKVYAAHRALRADGMARLPGAPPSLRRHVAPPWKVYLPHAPPPAAYVSQTRLYGRAVELRARRLEDRLARRSLWELRRWKNREPVPEIPCCLDAPHRGTISWAPQHGRMHTVPSAARQACLPRLSRSWRCIGVFSVRGARAAKPTAQRAAPRGERSGCRIAARRY